MRGPATAELIATRLEEEIVLGRRHPRERLIEQDLCEQFNTHRADVRLAFFELEKKGIIQRIPNRGAMVRDLSPQEVTEIYAVREELEVMAVRILPFPVARSDIDKLDEIQRNYSAAIDSGDLLNVFYGNLHFHRTLYELCGNTCLIETIEQLAQKVYGIRSYANAYPDALDRARRDHVAMIAALRTVESRRIDRADAAASGAFAVSLYTRLSTPLRRCRADGVPVLGSGLIQQKCADEVIE